MLDDIIPMPVMLFAPQRSGTTVFQATLSQGQEVEAFGEVFHENAGEYRLNFFNVLRRTEELRDLKSYPTDANAEKLFDRYIEILCAAASKRYFIVDVKENSLHHFNTIWNDIFAAPKYIAFTLARKFPVIRVRRDNLFLQVLSQDLSNKRGKWHFRVDERVELEAVQVNCAEYEARMERFSREGDIVDKWLMQYGNKIELKYEELFEDGQMSKSTLEGLSELLGISVAGEWRAPLRKSVVEPSKLISNVEEVVNYFRNSKFERFVRHVC